MNVFKFVSQYYWLIFIGVAVINYLMMDRSGLRGKYLGWLWGLSCVPWLVAGYGQIVGGVPNVWALFRPQDRNPYAWAFYGSILIVYVIGVYWVLFRDGARIAEELQLVKFNTPGKSGALSAFWIKMLAVTALPFFALWLWIAWKMNVPIIP